MMQIIVIVVGGCAAASSNWAADSSGNKHSHIVTSSLVLDAVEKTCNNQPAVRRTVTASGREYWQHN